MVNKFKENINYLIDSDIEVGISIDKYTYYDIGETSGEWLKIEPFSGNTSLSGTISTIGSFAPIDRYGDITAIGKVEREIASRQIKTLPLTVKQERHPTYYKEGETTIELYDDGTPAQSVLLSETGGTVLIKTYAIANDGSSHAHLTNPDYFSISASGSCIMYALKSKVETEDSLQWVFVIQKNSSLSGLSSTFTINFNNELDSIWYSTVSVIQAPHQQRYGNPVFYGIPTTVPYTGGSVTVKAYIPIDGINTPLNNVKLYSVSGYTQTDDSYKELELVMSGSTGYVNVLANDSDETPYGEPNRSFCLIAEDPRPGNRPPLLTDTIFQTTKKNAQYTFNFSDGSTSKILYGSPYDKSAQYLSFGLVSLKDDIEVNVNVSSDADFVTFESYSDQVLTLRLSENKNEELRNASITIIQDSSPMPTLTIELSQKGTSSKYDSFDYMVINCGLDFLSGEDLELLLYAPQMPSEFEKNKCVGYYSSEYLIEHDLSGTSYSISDLSDSGDTNVYSLAFAGNSNNSTGGFQSFVISPKQIFTEDFISNQIIKGNDYFDFELYGIFTEALYNGVVTIKMTSYTDDDNFPSTKVNSNGYGTTFVPSSSGVFVNEEMHHSIIQKMGHVEEFMDSYTKIGIIRYTYKTNLWEFIQNEESKSGADTDEEKEHIDKSVQFAESMHDDNDVLLDKVYYGYFKESSTNDRLYFNHSNDKTLGYANFGTNVDTEVYGFSLFYDQTLYQIISISCEEGNVLNWITNGKNAYEKKWQLTGDKSNDNIYLYNVKSVNSSEIFSKAIERDVYFSKLENAEEGTDVFPNGSLNGTLRDVVNNKTTNFVISSGTTPYRKITWNDTTNSSNLISDYVIIDTLNNLYSFVFAGFDTYGNTTPSATSQTKGEALKSFKYYYNSINNNLQLIFGKEAEEQRGSCSCSFQVRIGGRNETINNIQIFIVTTDESNANIVDWGDVKETISSFETHPTANLLTEFYNIIHNNSDGYCWVKIVYDSQSVQTAIPLQMSISSKKYLELNIATNQLSWV